MCYITFPVKQFEMYTVESNTCQACSVFSLFNLTSHRAERLLPVEVIEWCGFPSGGFVGQGTMNKLVWHVSLVRE